MSSGEKNRRSSGRPASIRQVFRVRAGDKWSRFKNCKYIQIHQNEANHDHDIMFTLSTFNYDDHLVHMIMMFTWSTWLRTLWYPQTRSWHTSRPQWGSSEKIKEASVIIPPTKSGSLAEFTFGKQGFLCKAYTGPKWALEEINNLRSYDLVQKIGLKSISTTWRVSTQGSIYLYM